MISDTSALLRTIVRLAEAFLRSATLSENLLARRTSWSVWPADERLRVHLRIYMKGLFGGTHRLHGGRDCS